MGIFLDSFRGIALNDGPLYLPPTARQRFEELAPLFLEAAGGDALLASFLAGTAWTESSFRADAVGPPVQTSRHGTVRAHGLMQIMEFHFPRLGWNHDEWRDPRQNLSAAMLLLRTDFGLGREPINHVIKKYIGAVRSDPFPEVQLRLNRAGFLLPEFIGMVLAGSDSDT